MKETDHLRGPLILCIDDDAASLQLRTEILNRHGYAVVAASVPGDGLNAFLTKDVALVMADSLLRGSSGINGRQLTERQ
jgi:CheY-like chemotaxis protein